MSIAYSGKTQNLKLYPQVAAQAINSGHARAYRLYVVVQNLVRTTCGGGIFSRADILAYCESLGVMNPQHVDRALHDGLGFCWEYSPLHRTYRLISRAKVAVAMGFTGNPGRAVYLPVEAFQGRLVNWKSSVYAAYLGQLYTTTPSRADLCAVFGVSIPTLLDWERRQHITVRPRIVMVDLEVDDPDQDQAQVADVSLEIDRSRTARTWLTVRGQRGRIIAGRRLMDNHNEPLPDYWPVQEEPGWEKGSSIWFSWQVSNDYASPLDPAPSGRGSWLKAEIRRLSTSDTNATGGTESCASDPDAEPKAESGKNSPRSSDDTCPGWHDDPAKVAKWQLRRSNTRRPAILAHYYKDRIVGDWQPSLAARLGENEVKKWSKSLSKT